MISLDEVTVCFGSTIAVDSVSLDVGPDETVALLGPSGCGKSTLLRAIAGLEPLGGGRILVDGEDLAGVAPQERGIGLMFQDHALFPHRNVADNIAFGLRMQGVHPSARAARVGELLDLVGLVGFEARSIATLSGGEAQRVALARALAPRPRLLLLDEPLGSLDRELRDRLVEELPVLLRAAMTAAIHVTHDHDEAFAVADRLAVMTHGAIRQTGDPAEVWSRPESIEVARFLGHTNIIAGVDGVVMVRADAAALAADGDAGDMTVTVLRSRFRGRETEIVVSTDEGDELTFVLPDRLADGTTVSLRLNPKRVVSLNP